MKAGVLKMGCKDLTGDGPGDSHALRTAYLEKEVEE
jgi:hypothetical protein